MTEHYQVECEKKAVFLSQELIAWFAIYCKDYKDPTDLHQLFADELNISRQEAKTLSHRIAFCGMTGMGNLGHLHKGGK